MNVKDGTVEQLTLDNVSMIEVAAANQGIADAMQALLDVDSGMPSDEIRKEIARNLSYAGKLLAELNCVINFEVGSMNITD